MTILKGNWQNEGHENNEQKSSVLKRSKQFPKLNPMNFNDHLRSSMKWNPRTHKIKIPPDSNQSGKNFPNHSVAFCADAFMRKNVYRQQLRFRKSYKIHSSHSRRIGGEKVNVFNAIGGRMRKIIYRSLSRRFPASSLPKTKLLFTSNDVKIVITFPAFRWFILRDVYST